MFYSIILIFIFCLQNCHCHHYTNHHEQLIWSSKCTKTLKYTSPISFLIHTNHSFTFSLTSSQKPNISISHSSSRFLVNNEWVSFMVKLCVLGEAEQDISRVLGLIFYIFFQICLTRRLLVNAYLSFEVDYFVFVFIEHFSRSILNFLRSHK